MSNAGLISTQSPTEKTSDIKRIVVSSVIGTAVEWYDFLIYGTSSALVFNKLYFPLSDPTLSTIAAFGTLRCRIFCPSFGRRDFWTLWRPSRSQGHARGDTHDHGAWYLCY